MVRMVDIEMFWISETQKILWSSYFFINSPRHLVEAKMPFHLADLQPRKSNKSPPTKRDYTLED